jgi:hypothetical protein|tara:strand:- start:65 stop:199 length:135 start_codon:yes stop_codon:yes gene_type:complete
VPVEVGVTTPALKIEKVTENKKYETPTMSRVNTGFSDNNKVHNL